MTFIFYYEFLLDRFIKTIYNSITPILNNFHSSIKFTYETESGNKLSFLNVQLIRSGDNIETCVFRKPTNTDTYINWDSFAPFQCKYSTLKTLDYHACIVGSDN